MCNSENGIKMEGHDWQILGSRPFLCHPLPINCCIFQLLSLLPSYQNFCDEFTAHDENQCNHTEPDVLPVFHLIVVLILLRFGEKELEKNSSDLQIRLAGHSRMG